MTLPTIAPPEAPQLELARLRVLRGPNIWRREPVITCELRCGASDIPNMLCDAALQLQRAAGSTVSFCKVEPSGEQGVYRIAVEYEFENAGLEAVREGLEVVRATIQGASFDTTSLIARLSELAETERLGPSTAAIVEEARRRGIPVRRLNDRSFVQLGLGRHLRRIEATLSDHTSIIAVDIAQDKELTKRVLRGVGLAVPDGVVATDVESAARAASEIGFPVVLKPLDGNHGRGISLSLRTPDEVRNAWARAGRERGREHERMVVERHVAGRDHRVLVVDGRVAAVAERIPAHVVGDGQWTVRDLIEAANRDPRRGLGHAKALTFLPDDETTEAYLALSGHGLETVPAAGERIFLRATANLSTGGTSIDRTDEMHPDNVTACEMAANAVGLDIAGLDVVSTDIGVPFHENGAVIVEINAAPGIRMHTDPTEGKPRNAAGAILDMLFPPGSRTTIPIIAVTGTNGKTTTTRLIAHLFRHTGRTVGFTTTDGVYLHHRRVVAGDMTGPFGANVVLTNRVVQVAVLETARGGILRAGLGYEECDVGIVLNVGGDHLGRDGVHTLEQLAEVKRVVPSVVKRRGYAVLNADDALVYAMADHTRGDVVLFSTRDDGPHQLLEEHVRGGGIAACVEHDAFVVYRGRLRIPIAEAAEVPLTLGGAARFQYGNVLAAIAAAYVQGMRYEDIRGGLLSFVPSPALTPGRLNLLEIGPGRVLVDYAHNPAAVAGLVDVVQGFPAARRIGVITIPGDRRDADLREVGRLCAVFDRVIIKEDADRRGREPGEISRVIAEGLAAGGLDAGSVEQIHAEREAIAHAVGLMRADDLVVVLAEDVPTVLAQLRT